MSSLSLHHWFNERAAILDELEKAHRFVHGSGQGARAATLQVNQAYTVLLAAQFQGFCRELHTECSDILAMSQRHADLGVLIRSNLLNSRKLDRGNPNVGNVGSDFNRFNMTFWLSVDADHSRNPQRKLQLEELNYWRNAIAHQDFPATLLVSGRPALRFAMVRSWRQACDALAQSFDNVLRDRLRSLTGNVPW